MRRALTWFASILVGLAAVVGLIALLNSRDDSQIEGSDASAARGPGQVYRGEPVLSPALEQAIKRGNVVVLHRDEEPPAGTTELVPPGGAALERAGQAVLIEREPTLGSALAAVSEERIQPGAKPEDLEGFIDYWLGGR